MISFHLLSSAVQVTLERSDFDNTSEAATHWWEDGLFGAAWLSRDSCIRAEVTKQNVLECPYGGYWRDRPDGGVRRHPFCDDKYGDNYSHSVAVDPSAYVRCSPRPEPEHFPP